MSAARKITVELSSQEAELIDRKLETGEFSNESEVIQESLQALRERDMDFEVWLREEVGPVYDAHMADPSRAIPMEEVFRDVRARYLERKSKNG